ncbi:MAG: hypothetical protein HUJ98_11990, partial [Bacteroidaceae bacterium]|nr:hypothetical protein [Bacteroidaceae bacterium]
IVIIGNGYDNASSTILVYLGSAGKNAFEKLKGGKADARKTITVGDYIDVKVGDVTGDGKANIVAYTSKRLDTSKDSKSQPRGPAGKIYVMDYQNMTSSNSKAIEIQEPQSHFVYHRGVELVAFRGPAQAKDIVGTRQVWRYGDNQKFTAVHEHPSQFGHRDNYENANSEYAESYMPKDGMAVGDFLGNGTEQLVYLPHWVQVERGGGGKAGGEGQYDEWAWTRSHTVAKNKMLYVDNTGKFQKKQFAGNDDVDFIVSENTAGKHSTSNFTKWREVLVSFSYAVPLLDKPKSVFKFKNYTPTISEPRIYALLAAPPYFAGYEYQNTPSTTWGSSRSNSSGTSTSTSNSASLIFGYEQEISVFGINIGGFDFETQLTSGVEKSVEKSYTTTSSTSYSILDDDGVVMLVTPYDTYTYECVSAPSEDGIGAEMTVSIPREPRMMLMSLTDYTRLRADNLDIPDLRSVFTHTPGDPFSYPVDEDQYNVPKEQVFWADDNNSEMIGTGSSGMVTRSVEITDEIVNSGSTSFNMDVKLVAKSGGVKAGAGYSYSTTTGMSHSVGKGFSIEGQVMSPKNYTDITPFRWNVCWYKVKVNGQEFPVVNYLVRKN